MTKSANTVNTINGKAPLANVALLLGALDKLTKRPDHLPGIGVFYGPSGYGKSTAAAVGCVRHRCYYVQARSSWTKKAAHQAILKVMGIMPGKTMAEMSDQVAEQLASSKRPLVVDEADYLVDKGSIEIIRDIYEASLAPILIIGEERLPYKLKKYERFHGRVLAWVPAQPASLDDALALRDLYATCAAVADDMMELIHAQADGSVRRIVVNLELAQDTAKTLGLNAMDAAAWGGRALYTGDAPSRS